MNCEHSAIEPPRPKYCRRVLLIVPATSATATNGTRPPKSQGPFINHMHDASTLQCSDATVYVHLIIANSQPLAFASLKPNQPGQVRARQAGALQDHHDTSALTKLQSGARTGMPRAPRSTSNQEPARQQPGAPASTRRRALSMQCRHGVVGVRTTTTPARGRYARTTTERRRGPRLPLGAEARARASERATGGRPGPRARVGGGGMEYECRVVRTALAWGGGVRRPGGHTYPHGSGPCSRARLRACSP